MMEKIIKMNSIFEMKYYFIYYEWKRRFWPDSTGICRETSIEDQALIHGHPLSYQIQFNKQWKTFDDVGGKASEQIKIINWHEISEEEFERFKDQI